MSVSIRVPRAAPDRSQRRPLRTAIGAMPRMLALSFMLTLSWALAFLAENTAAQTDIAAPGASSAASKAQGSASTAAGIAQTETRKEAQKDAEFVQTAARMLNTQIEASKFIAQQAQTEKVREYAGWIVKDYEPALMRLREIADKARLDGAAETVTAGTDKVAEMAHETAPQRDQEYLALMKEQHEQLIALCDRAHAEAQLAVELREFGDKLLPTLQQYRKRAEKLLQMPPPALSNAGA